MSTVRQKRSKRARKRAAQKERARANKERRIIDRVDAALQYGTGETVFWLNPSAGLKFHVSVDPTHGMSCTPFTLLDDVLVDAYESVGLQAEIDQYLRSTTVRIHDTDQLCPDP